MAGNSGQSPVGFAHSRTQVNQRFPNDFSLKIRFVNNDLSPGVVVDLFRNLSLRKKIFAFNVFMSAFLLAAVGASYWGAKRAGESYRGIVEVEHRLSQSIGAMESTKSEMFNHYLRLAYADLGSEEGRAAVTRLTALKEIYMKNSEAFDELVP